MDIQDFLRSKALNNIPQKKLSEVLSSIETSQDDLQTKTIKLTLYNRYYEANIPIEYWFLKMDIDFQGDQKLLSKYNEYVKDLREQYISGSSFCLAGQHGVGKTMVCNSILKKACAKGYVPLYTTLSDVINAIIYSPGDEKYLSKKELSMVDFLVLDEVDNRFFSQSEGSNEMFSRSFETIIRTRLQNKLPTIIATNSPNIKETFTSIFKESLGSLMSRIPIFTVMPGQDFRKKLA